MLSRAAKPFILTLDSTIYNVALKNNKPAVQHILRIILDIPDLEVTETVIQDIIQNRVQDIQ